MRPAAVAVGLAAGLAAAWLAHLAVVTALGPLWFWGGTRCTEMGCFSYLPAGMFLSLGVGTVTASLSAQGLDGVLA